MVTAGTYGKQPLFRSPDRLRLLCGTLCELADEYGWLLQAWAVFPNHYHFVALSPADATSLRALVRHLHSVTARAINAQEKTPRRRVWFEYWDSHLTYQRSYFARLNYAHGNAVRHGVVRVASVVLRRLVRAARRPSLFSDHHKLSLRPPPRAGRLPRRPLDRSLAFGVRELAPALESSGHPRVARGSLL